MNRLSFLLILVLPVYCGASWAESGDAAAKENMAVAKDAYAKENWDEAFTRLSALSFPDTKKQDRLLFLSGTVALRKGDYQSAAAIYRRMKEASPAARYHRAFATAHLGKIDKAYKIMQGISREELVKEDREVQTQIYAYHAQLAVRLEHRAIAWVLFSRARGWIDDADLPALLSAAEQSRDADQFSQSLSGKIDDEKRVRILSAENELQTYQPSLVKTLFDLDVEEAQAKPAPAPPEPEAAPMPIHYDYGVAGGFLRAGFQRQESAYWASQLLVSFWGGADRGAWRFDAHADLGLILLGSGATLGSTPRYFSWAAEAKRNLFSRGALSLHGGGELVYQTFLGSDSAAGYANLPSILATVDARYPVTEGWEAFAELAAGPAFLDGVGIFQATAWRGCFGAAQVGEGRRWRGELCYWRQSFPAGLSLSSASLLLLSAGVSL